MSKPGTRLSPVGAVIGATAPQEGRRLRQLLSNAIILAPGLGAQGGDPAALCALRGAQRGDLLVPVSRGLLRAEDRGIALIDYAQLIGQRLQQMKAAIAAPESVAAAGCGAARPDKRRSGVCGDKCAALNAAARARSRPPSLPARAAQDS